MKRGTKAPKAPVNNCRQAESPSMLLAMLDSLSEALDKKADDIEDSGAPDGDVRASTLRDVSAAIKDQFAL